MIHALLLLSMEIRHLGGLITPACSYNSCVPHRVIWGLLAFALCCIVDFGPCLLVCPGSSVGRALCLDRRVSRGFESHLGQLIFSLKKVLSWVQLNCLLCTCVVYHLTMIHTYSDFQRFVFCTAPRVLNKSGKGMNDFLFRVAFFLYPYIPFISRKTVSYLCAVYTYNCPL